MIRSYPLLFSRGVREGKKSGNFITRAIFTHLTYNHDSVIRSWLLMVWIEPRPVSEEEGIRWCSLNRNHYFKLQEVAVEETDDGENGVAAPKVRSRDARDSKSTSRPRARRRRRSMGPKYRIILLQRHHKIKSESDSNGSLKNREHLKHAMSSILLRKRSSNLATPSYVVAEANHKQQILENWEFIKEHILEKVILYYRYCTHLYHDRTYHAYLPFTYQVKVIVEEDNEEEVDPELAQTKLERLDTFLLMQFQVQYCFNVHYFMVSLNSLPTLPTVTYHPHELKMLHLNEVNERTIKAAAANSPSSPSCSPVADNPDVGSSSQKRKEKNEEILRCKLFIVLMPISHHSSCRMVHFLLHIYVYLTIFLPLLIALHYVSYTMYKYTAISCSIWQSNVYQSGTLDVYPSKLQFQFKIIGPPIRVCFADVTSVTKETTRLVQRDSLKIQTQQKAGGSTAAAGGKTNAGTSPEGDVVYQSEYFFSGFSNRDEIYELLTHLWNIAIEKRFHKVKNTPRRNIDDDSDKKEQEGEEEDDDDSSSDSSSDEEEDADQETSEMGENVKSSAKSRSSSQPIPAASITRTSSGSNNRSRSSSGKMIASARRGTEGAVKSTTKTSSHAKDKKSSSASHKHNHVETSVCIHCFPTFV